MPLKKVDHGRNIKCLRNMLGYTQEQLAFELEMSQQAFSDLEKRDIIDDTTLGKIAKVMKVPVEAIKNFDESKAINIFSNTFNSHDTSTLHAVNYYPSFNPLEKIIELYNDKVALYERMLKAEEEKTKTLERLLEKQLLK